MNSANYFPMRAVTVIGAVCSSLMAGAAQGEGKAVPEREAVSFVDDFAIEEKSGLVRQLEKPAKVGKPVIAEEAAWEKNPFLFGSVVIDPVTKMYRMWYMSYNRNKPMAERTPVLYAESKDGITWTRPKLRLYEFEGSKENNIVLRSLGFDDLYNPSVVEDPKEKDPSKRFKMIFWDKTGKDSYKNGGMHVAFSPDGINWKRYEGNPVLKAGRNDRSISDVMDVMIDPKTGKYVVYAKGWNNETWNADEKVNEAASQRIIVRSESDDFVNWSEPKAIIRHAKTEADPQSYGMPVFYHDGVYLGLMRSYKLPGDERMNIRLMSSRDGVKWAPVCEGETYIDTGENDAKWDDGMILTAPPVVDGDKIRIYYSGWDGPHQSKVRHAAIGLAEVSAGRLAGLTPEGTAGTLVTKAFSPQGKELLLNAASKRGECRVAVIDRAGQELPGYGLADSEVARESKVRLPVKWKGKSLAELPAEEVRLKIELRDKAKVYGYYLEKQ